MNSEVVNNKKNARFGNTDKDIRTVNEYKEFRNSLSNYFRFTL